MKRFGRFGYCAVGFLAGVGTTAAVLSIGTGSKAVAVPLDSAAAAATGAGGSQLSAGDAARVSVDERDMRLGYANAYRIHTAAEEVVLDFGFNMPDPNVPAGAKPSLLFKVENRVVLTYRTAKRLQTSLTTLISRYETEFGEIPLETRRKE